MINQLGYVCNPSGSGLVSPSSINSAFEAKSTLELIQL